MSYEDDINFDKNADERFENHKKDMINNEKAEVKKNINIFEEEYEKRTKLYKSKINETFNLNDSDTQSVNDEPNFKEEQITDRDKINEILSVYKRDGITFNIEEGKQKYLNNKIISIDEHIVISNPFTTFANKSFPKQIRCIVEKDGNEYGFLLKKLNDNDSGGYIQCLIPTEINILRRRGCERASDHSKSAVGLFLDSRNKEIIGYMRDISESGIGFSIGDSAIDNDSLSFISVDSDYKLPIIIENKGKYITILINIKYTEHNKTNKTIEIGACFDYIENDEVETIKSVFRNIQKDSIIFNKKEKTSNLINLSKMDVDI